MASVRWRMSDGGWRMADVRWRMANVRWRMADDGCRTGDDSGEWRVASEIGVASGTGIVVSSQWSVVSESGGSGEPPQERRPAPEKAPNEAKLESTQSSLPLDVESSAPEPAGRKRSQFGGRYRSTLHASCPQWPVNLEGVASGEWRREAVKKANPSATSRRQR